MSAVGTPSDALPPWHDPDAIAREAGVVPRGYALKRPIDLVLATLLLVISAPLIALAALAVRLETHGGALYRQKRVGRLGDTFEVVKLRTMVHGAEHIGAGMAIDAGDTRITRVGAILRRTSIDELPNLINVLRGEMALVGPRPTLRAQVDRYTPRQRGRLLVRPGITGWAQINGRATLPWSERIELDLEYVERCSPALDLRILARTVRIALGGSDLYRGDAGGWR